MTQIKAASTIQELKKRADVDQPAESGGEVDVYKFRSIFSQENFYTFHRILESEKLDLFLLTETWHTQSTPTTLLNRNYNILLCNNDERRGDGAALEHKSDLIVSPLFPEFHTRNLLPARLSSQTIDLIILLMTYFPPDFRHAV